MAAKFAQWLRRLAGWLEGLAGGLVLCLLLPALHGLGRWDNLHAIVHEPAAVYAYLSALSALLIGTEFVRMLVRHTVYSLTEIVCLAIARQVLTGRLSYPELLLSALAVALACVILARARCRRADSRNPVVRLDDSPTK